MMPERDWVGILLTILGIVVPLIISQWWVHRQNSEAIKVRDQKLFFVLGEHIPHTHGETEKDEALTVAGIKYPNMKFNGH